MAQIKARLLTGASITPQGALDIFRCFRLASIIHRLRKQGLPIENTGTPGGHAKYRIKPSYFKGQAELPI